MKLLHVFTGVLLLTSPALAQSAALSSPLDTSSIFSRTRGLPPATTSGASTGTQPRRPANVSPPLFMGTFQEQDHMVALLEVQTPEGSTVLTLHEGDTIPWDQSHVVTIASDHMQLSSGTAETRIITLGNNLLNQANDFATPGRPLPSAPMAPRNPRQRTASPMGTRASNPQGTSPVIRQ